MRYTSCYFTSWIQTLRVFSFKQKRFDCSIVAGHYRKWKSNVQEKNEMWSLKPIFMSIVFFPFIISPLVVVFLSLALFWMQTSHFEITSACFFIPTHNLVFSNYLFFFRRFFICFNYHSSWSIGRWKKTSERTCETKTARDGVRRSVFRSYDAVNENE